MSAKLLENGSYSIGPTEFERVFPIVSRDSLTQPNMTQSGISNDTGVAWGSSGVAGAH